MDAKCSAELGSIRVSDQCSQLVSEPVLRLVTDECAQRNTDVDSKRVANQCSQHEAYVAVSQLLTIRVSDSSADWVVVLLSFCKPDDEAILPTRHVTDECAQRDTDVDSKRVADQCSQHDAYVAVSQLLAVRVSDSSADLVAVLLSFCKPDDEAIDRKSVV